MSPKQSSNSSAAVPPNKNVLPPKEQNLFKSVVRFYETKQLKKALKAADTVLKKFPDHGETLAMKGLTLNALDKKSEAIDLVRRGLRMDMKSHICWHVYGLLYRSERDYREAAKAYLNALRIDKDNQQILRDLALLQIQIRDYDGLEDTRRRLLTVRPNQRNNWIGFALSFHLLGNFSTAVSVLDTYHDTLTQSNEPEDRYETSELLLYKNMILEEDAQYAEALAHLDSSSVKLVDRLAVCETRARLHAALGRYEEASQQLRSLLAINPDNHFYHHALHTCAIRAKRASNGVANGHPIPPATEAAPDAPLASSGPITGRSIQWQSPALARIANVADMEAVSCALAVCDELTTAFPRSRTAQRIALDIIPDPTHPEFVPRVDAYVRPFLRRGIPSLFSDLKPMYTNSTKIVAFAELFESFKCSLEEHRRLPPLKPLPDSNSTQLLHKPEPDGEEESTTLLWVLHFLAQHYDRLGKHELALETIEAAIVHTPETIECYLVKARILKHCGDFKGAVDTVNKARNLDLADRYLNTKCCKYALQADMVSEAETWVGLFTRDGDSGGVQALYDMQCMWFELGAAESHFRRGQIAQAMKKFTAVERHFADMIEDQFDFHSYCLRKVTLRAYVTLLRFEDRIRGHPFFSRAAGGLARCLLRLMDMTEKERSLIIGEHSDIQGYAEMTDAQRKKAVSKRKKQLARQRQNIQSSSGGKSSGKYGGNDGEKGQGVNDGKTTNSNASNENRTKANPGWMDIDANGLEAVKDLLKKGDKSNRLMEEATRVIGEMQEHLGEEMQTQELVFELAIRKKKYLQALRAVRKAKAIDTESGCALFLVIRLTYELDKEGVRQNFSDVVRKVYEVEGDILNGMSTREYMTDYMKRHGHHAERRVGANRVKLWMARMKVEGCGSVQQACDELCAAIDESSASGMDETAFSARACKSLIDGLKAEGVVKSMVEQVAACCRKKHKRATCL